MALRLGRRLCRFESCPPDNENTQTIFNVAIAQRLEQDTVNIEMEVRFFLVTVIISYAYLKR